MPDDTQSHLSFGAVKFHLPFKVPAKFGPCKFGNVVLAVFATIFIILLIVFVLIITSLSYVPYNKMAFKRNILSKTVDASKSYSMGRYFWGPFHEAIYFPANYQLISFRDGALVIFSKDGLNFELQCDIYYKISPDNMQDIFSQFGLSYHVRFVDAIRASIKNSGPNFTVEDYYVSRPEVSEKIRKALNVDLKSVHLDIEPSKFAILTIDLPDSTNLVNLNTALQSLQNQKAALQREVDLIFKGTDEEVAKINANITVIKITAEAQADRMVQNAQAESNRIQQQAIGGGLDYLFDKLNVTTAAEMDKFFEFFTLLDSEKNPVVISGDASLMLNLN